ncbi:MAG: anti-sigma regulatory factor [Ectothiorhodospiraceae bacterium]|nr:anti-sigma regulatory factor [Ectothiorhodospiraceae bacterium]
MKTLTVPGTLEALDEIGEFVMDFGQGAGLEKKKIYRLRLAVDEISTNVILHGYKEAGIDGKLTFEAEETGEDITIRLFDTGVEYDPNEKANPESLNKPLEERPIGGLGVFLSIQSVDKFLYERKDGKNIHTFVVRK